MLLIVLFAQLIFLIESKTTFSQSPKIIQFGKTVTLKCVFTPVSNKSVNNNWYKDNNLIIQNKNKYVFKLNKNKNKMRLKIKNVTEKDLTPEYACEYNNNKQSYMIRINTETFEYNPGKFHIHNYGNLLTVLTFKKVFPIPICNLESPNKEILNFKKDILVQTSKFYYNIKFYARFDKNEYCDMNISIICHISKENIIVEHIKPTKCKKPTISYTTRKPYKDDDTDIIILAIVVIVVVIISVILIFWWGAWKQSKEKFVYV